MSLLFRRAETRSLSYQDVWGSGGTWDAVVGGPDVVSGGLALGAVYSATSLIADLVATAPRGAYRLSADGVTRARLPRQPQLLTHPGPLVGWIDWVHQAMASLLLRGNAYGYVTALDNAGSPSQVIWFNPDDVAVIQEQVDWYHWPSYYWRGRPLDRDLLIHLRGYTMAGNYLGYSPLALFKTQIEGGLRAIKYGDEWFKHGANPAGHLKNTTQTLDRVQAEKAKNRFKATVANHDVFVSGSDWDYKSLAVPADEAQFLETIRATATQVAAIYRVSPDDVGGEAASGLTYKTLEQDNSKLTIRTLGVWCARFAEQLSERLPRGQEVDFNLDFMARGDLTSRMLAHSAALAAGIETNAEARAAEGKPPLTDEEAAQWQEWYGGDAQGIGKKVTSTAETTGLKDSTHA
ncbi:MAG TPA: phage portal protein [Nocardioides sp.]|nr:phage portal protein [Nocardioides sp.]